MTKASVFIEFAYDLLDTSAKKKSSVLKDHPHVPFLLDIISRCENHHAVLTNAHEEKINRALMESFTHQLSAEHLPKVLRHFDFIYFDAHAFVLPSANQEQVAEYFNVLKNKLHQENKRVIFAINAFHLLEKNNAPAILFFYEMIKTLLTNDQWRFIFFTSQKNLFHPIDNSLLTYLPMMTPTTQESLSLLKSYRASLEDFHQVMISDETFASAHSLAAHYLSGIDTFTHAVKLLDSASARVSALERDHQTGHKPIVTNHALLHIISSWTQIPLTHLQNNKFQANKLIEALHRRVFGQDTAIHFIASLLQNACLKLQETRGPFCHFLFVGPSDVGKTETAHALAEYLFGREDALLRVDLTYPSPLRLKDIKVISRAHTNRNIDLLSAIAETPYAIILLEDIDQISEQTLDLFKNLLAEGYAFDESGNQYDFRHATIIMTTRFSAAHIQQLFSAQSAPDATKTVDLMQLVLSDHVIEPSQSHHSFLSPQELSEEILPKLTEHFSPLFLQKVNIVPFIPLDYHAFEKIIRTKIKTLTKRLEANLSIELNCSPEVIQFLAHELLWKKQNSQSLNKLLEQHLYTPISHAILLHADDKNKLKRLLVRLNDSGQLLQCEFITANEAALYNL